MKQAHAVAVDHPLERMIFFSDAVFAIAITLLIIEVHVPVLSGATDADYGKALLNLLPSFFGFVLSFLVIARFWTGHHAAFGMTARYDPSLMWPNLMLLMAIAFMPFATAFMARNIGERVPTLVYNATLLATGILSYRVISRVTSIDHLRADADREMAAAIPARGKAVIIVTFMTLVFGLYNPSYSQLVLGTMPLVSRTLRRRAKPAS